MTFDSVGCFFAGYYLVNYDLSKWVGRAIYLLGVIGWIKTIVITIVKSLKQEDYCVIPYQHLTPNVF